MIHFILDWGWIPLIVFDIVMLWNIRRMRRKSKGDIEIKQVPFDKKHLPPWAKHLADK